MGTYQLPTIKIVFDEDSGRHGLVVRMEPMSIEQWITLSHLEDAGGGGLFELLRRGLADEVNELLALVSASLIEWNLLDRQGQPVPTTADALRSVDPWTIVRIISGWIRAATGVSPPLPQPSPGGDPFPEASLPMEPPSSGQPNSPTPS